MTILMNSCVYCFDKFGIRIQKCTCISKSSSLRHEDINIFRLNYWKWSVVKALQECLMTSHTLLQTFQIITAKRELKT